MDRRVIPFFILLAAWIGLGLWLCNRYLCNGGAATSKVSQSSLAPVPATKDAWTFNDQSNFNHSSGERFQFGLSGIGLLNGANAEIKNSVSSVATYLKANPSRGLNIVGHYLDTETNNTLSPNLGVARANVVKDMMVAAGVSGKQLSTSGKLLADAKYATGEGVMHGINFNFGESVGDSRLSDIKARLLGKPLTVYFKTGESDINFSAEQRTDLADMVYYLENVSEAKLNIGGHTDSQGRRSNNIKLSQDRAEFVAGYLTSKGGINSAKMVAEGMGPDKPVADNDSSRGRAANRRVEIVLN